MKMCCMQYGFTPWAEPACPISAERDYPDVDVMREKAAESLNAGMAYALKYSLIKLVRREALIPHHTVEAYNEVLTELQQQEG